LPGTNALAYYENLQITAVKFKTLAPVQFQVTLLVFKKKAMPVAKISANAWTDFSRQDKIFLFTPIVNLFRVELVVTEFRQSLNISPVTLIIKDLWTQLEQDYQRLTYKSIKNNNCQREIETRDH
jgi:hypothetical protein